MTNGLMLDELRRMARERDFDVDDDVFRRLVLAELDEARRWREEHEKAHKGLEKRVSVAGVVAVVTGAVAGMFRR